MANPFNTREFQQGRAAGDASASSARMEAFEAGIQASSANFRARLAQDDADSARDHARSAETQADQAILALGFAKVQIDAWKARFERERAARRGWQQSGMAARDLIQKLAGVDRDAAEKLIDQTYAENKGKIDASKTKVDEWNFTGVEPGKN